MHQAVNLQDAGSNPAESAREKDMWELIALTVYGFLALCTFLAIMSDNNIQISARYVLIFILMAFIWPIVWTVYFLSDKR